MSAADQTRVEPGSQAWCDRVVGIVAEEVQQPDAYWYTSYADERGFRGAVIVRARGVTLAVMRAHELGINPGGEALTMRVPDEMVVPPEFLDRLLSREDVKLLDGK